jgi:phospholipid transport system substrate-binding protein
MFKKFCFSLLFICFLAPTVNAAEILPDEMLETSITNLLATFEERRDELNADKQKLYDLVEDEVVPHFAVSVIARLVLAKHWRKASDTQRVEFAEQFKRLLVRTYATALFEYTGNEKMEVRPVTIKAGDRKARVRTEVTLPGIAPVSVNYSFLLEKDDVWRIYDINIDGISLVKNYRTSYGQMVAANGLDHLIDELERKNSSFGAS